MSSTERVALVVNDQTGQIAASAEPPAFLGTICQ